MRRAPDMPRAALLTTSQAAAYCGYATAAGLRKAWLSGRVQPEGRRGGTGKMMWSHVELDRFLRGAPAGSVR